MKKNILLLVKIKTYFLSQKEVKKAYLFGSYARNEQRTDSDIDLLIELDNPNKISLLDIATMKVELGDLLKKEVDLIPSNSLSKFVQTKVEQEKKLIYER